MKLAKRLQPIKNNIPKNFPKTNSQTAMGFVKSKAIVPDLIYSEKAFIPIAGIRNKNNQGINSKYKLRSAKPESIKLKAFVKTQRSNPFKIKKTASMLYPNGVVKKDSISLLAMTNMLIEFNRYSISEFKPKQALSAPNSLRITFVY